MPGRRDNVQCSPLASPSPSVAEFRCPDTSRPCRRRRVVRRPRRGSVLPPPAVRQPVKRAPCLARHLLGLGDSRVEFPVGEPLPLGQGERRQWHLRRLVDQRQPAATRLSNRPISVLTAGPPPCPAWWRRGAALRPANRPRRSPVVWVPRWSIPDLPVRKEKPRPRRHRSSGSPRRTRSQP